MPSTITDRLSGLTTSVAVKPPCKAVSVVSLTMIGEQTVGGVPCVDGDRVLMAITGGSVNNGPWVVRTSAWERAKDFNGARDVVTGTMILVKPGSTDEQFWVVKSLGDIFPGTSSIVIEQHTPEELSLAADLADTTDAANGDALIGVLHTGTSAVATTVHARIEGDSFQVFDFLSVAQRADVRSGALAVDCTTAVQAALSAAFAAGVASVQMMDGTARIDGMLSIPSGVTLYANGSASEYYFGSPFGTIAGAKLYKRAASGTAGPLVELSTGSAIRGLYLHHDKASTSLATAGVVRIGSVGTGNVCYSAAVKDCRIYGNYTGDVTGATTCYGIYFPPSTTPIQRYFNTVSDVSITNCDVGIRLNSESNANKFTDLIIRNCKYYIEIDGSGGGTGALENVFTGLVLQYIGTAPANCVVFKLSGTAINNTFVGYSTECQGSLFGTDDGTCSGNYFVGHANESVASAVYAGSRDYDYTQPVNVSQQQQMLVLDPSRTTDKFLQGVGNKISIMRKITGTMPDLNINAGTMTAASTSCKKIITFDPSLYVKAERVSFRCALRVYLNAPGGGVGEAFREVVFLYRVNDNSTNAASLSVLSVSGKPATNWISGLYFCTGVAAAAGFSIALVGGNAGATTATHVVVSMEIEAITHDTNAVAMASLANFTFATAAATANDVTDAISLTTVADTAV